MQILWMHGGGNEFMQWELILELTLLASHTWDVCITEHVWRITNHSIDDHDFNINLLLSSYTWKSIKTHSWTNFSNTVEQKLRMLYLHKNHCSFDGIFVPQCSSINHALFWSVIATLVIDTIFKADKEFDKSVRWPTRCKLMRWHRFLQCYVQWKHLAEYICTAYFSTRVGNRWCCKTLILT